MEAALVRAARAYLDWSQGDLAERADVSVGTVRNYEAGVGRRRPKIVKAIQGAFERAGVLLFVVNGHPCMLTAKDVEVTLDVDTAGNQVRVINGAPRLSYQTKLH